MNPAVLCATASFLAHLHLHLRLHLDLDLDLSLVRPFVPSSRSRSRYAPPWPWSSSSLTTLSLTCPHLQPQTNQPLLPTIPLPCCFVPSSTDQTKQPLSAALGAFHDQMPLSSLSTTASALPSTPAIASRPANCARI